MPSRIHSITYEEFTAEALGAVNARLCAAAEQAVDLAYAPYSRFRVGAAAQLEDGTLVPAANLENAAYPQCLCAEATLLGALHTQHPGRRVVAVAVCAREAAGDWVAASPCGSCRQQLLEAERRQGADIALLLHRPGGPTLRFASAAALLPLGFAF